MNAAYKKRCPTMDASATMQTTRSIQIIKSFPSETSILLGRMQGIVPVKKTISPIASTPTTKRDTMEAALEATTMEVTGSATVIAAAWATAISSGIMVSLVNG